MKNDPNKIETAPFDLEKAMAGHPIIQRDGRRIGILEIHHEPDFFPLNMRLVTKKKQYATAESTTFWRRYTEDGCTPTDASGELDLLLDLSRPWRAKFDLQKALDGHPLVTRNGEKVHSLEPCDDPNFPLLANCGSRDMEIGGKKYSGLVVKRCYTRKGRASMDTKGPMDLFLDLRAKFEQAHADQKAEPPGRKMINCRCVAVPELHPFPTKLAIGQGERMHPQEVDIDAIEPEAHYRIASVVVRMEGASEDDPNLLRFAEALVARYNALLRIERSNALEDVAKASNTDEADER